VVVLTAYAEIELAVLALKRGALDFITKPWENVRLVAACREALQSTRHDPNEQIADPPAAAEQTRSLAAQERAAVMAAVAGAHGNLSEAARVLGVSRAALYRRLEKHGL
jgi:two-component system, response regulator RegA